MKYVLITILYPYIVYYFKVQTIILFSFHFLHSTYFVFTWLKTHLYIFKYFIQRSYMRENALTRKLVKLWGFYFKYSKMYPPHTKCPPVS